MARIGTSVLAAAALWLLCVFFCVGCAFFCVGCAFFCAFFSVSFRFTPVLLHMSTPCQMESFTHPTVRPRTFAASSSSNSASGGSSEAPTHSRRFRLLAATRPTPIQLVGRTMASAAHPSHCTSRCSSNMDGNPMPPSMCDGAEIQRRWYLRVMLEVYRMRSVTARRAIAGCFLARTQRAQARPRVMA